MPPAEPERAVYRFDQFQLDTQRGMLRRANGTDLPLRPRTYALLRHFLDHPGQLLRRDALIEAIWPRVVVTDDSLTQCVSELRQALGDRASEVLRTVPRRGYILMGEVRRAGYEPERPSRPAGAEPARTTFVMVTPPEHAADDLVCGRLARMLGTDLVTDLATMEEVRVVASGQEHAEGAYRISGEVWRSGATLRASFRLVSAAGIALWAEKLSVPANEHPEPDESQIGRLAITLVRQIGLEDLRQARATRDEELTARQLCLLAREHHQNATERDTLVARDYLERAIALDPNYAPAYAWLCFVVQRALTQGWGEMDGEVAREKALVFARRAVHLEPSSPLCVARLAYALMLHRRYEEAVTAAREALRLRRWLTWESLMTAGETLGCCGCHEEAIEALQKALAEDPLCPPSAHGMLGRSLLLDGRAEEALLALQLCRARLPAYLPCLQSIVVAAVEAGQMAVAADAFADLRRHHPWWTTASSCGHWFVRHASEDQRFWNAFGAIGGAA